MLGERVCRVCLWLSHGRAGAFRGNTLHVCGAALLELYGLLVDNLLGGEVAERGNEGGGEDNKDEDDNDDVHEHSARRGALMDVKVGVSEPVCRV